MPDYKEINLGKITQNQFEGLTSSFELDMIALMKIIQQEALEILESGEDMTAEAMEAMISGMFDGGPSVHVAKAKMHSDRLANKYGQNDVRGKKYQALMEKIIARNSANIKKSISRITDKRMRQQMSQVTDAKTRRKVTLTFPEYQEVLPKERVIFKKAAEQGQQITGTIKNRLTGALRHALKGYEREGKRYRGRLRPEMIRDFKRELKKVFQDYTKTDPKYGVPSNIRNIAVTEMRSAVNEIRDEYVREVLSRNPGLSCWKAWIHNRSLSKVPRKGHLELHKAQIPYDKQFKVKTYDNKGRYTGIVKMTRPHDPTAPLDQIIGCVLGGQRIFSPDVQKMYRRWYSGDIIHVQTAAGLELSITPNHPVLADQGWIAADSLKVGMNVISVNPINTVSVADMYINNRPPAFSEVFNFFSIIFKVMGKSGSNADFHGDGEDGNVDVIDVNSLLVNRIKFKLLKHVNHFKFALALILKGLFPDFCQTYKTVQWHLAGLRPFFSSLLSNIVFVLLRNKPVSVYSGLFNGSDMNTSIYKACSDSHAINPVYLRELQKRFTGFIQFDNIVKIVVDKSFSGHVYNLQTKSGVYLVNRSYHNDTNMSIVVHNCSCELKYLMRYKSK